MVEGGFYFIKDDFFLKFQNENFKKNKEFTARPHVFAFKDSKTNLYWMIPVSSRIEKYERLLTKFNERKKSTEGIRIITMPDGKKQALLFQDMFPISSKYIDNAHYKNNNHYSITNLKLVQAIKYNALSVKNKLLRRIDFVPNHPNVIYIEQVLKREAELTNNNYEYFKNHLASFGFNPPKSIINMIIDYNSLTGKLSSIKNICTDYIADKNNKIKNPLLQSIGKYFETEQYNKVFLEKELAKQKNLSIEK